MFQKKTNKSQVSFMDINNQLTNKSELISKGFNNFLYSPVYIISIK